MGLREVKGSASSSGALPAVAATHCTEAVDSVAEMVNCLRGLGGDAETEAVQEGFAWLLSRQEANGYFYAPGAKGNYTAYSHLHPTWAAVAALQVDRGSPCTSQRRIRWAKHARAAAQEV